MAPMSYQAVEEGIVSLEARMEVLTDDFTVAVNDQAEAKVAYEIAVAKARLGFRADPPVGQKVTDQMVADNAMIVTEDLRRAHLIADAKFEAVKNACFVSRDRLGALRSLMKAYTEAGG